MLKKLFYKIASHHKIILFSRIADSDRFLQNRDKIKSVIFWTTHKCASTFISSYLKSISSVTNLKHYDYAGHIWELGNEIKLDKPFLIESDCDFLYRRFGELYGPMRTPFEFDTRKYLNNIFFLRDPRDLIISKYYSIAYSHPIPSNKNTRRDFLKKRDEAKELGINDFSLKQIDEWIIPYYTKYKFMKENSNLSSVFKYEDLKKNPKKIFLELTSQMKIDVSEKLVLNLVEKFEKPFTNKIKNNNNNYYLHTRSGENRQFEHEFNKDFLSKINKKLEDIINYWNFKI